jgi:hypothetical protein
MIYVSCVLQIGKKRWNSESEELRGPSLPREYQCEDIEKVLFRKIKVQFPILFKRALKFHRMKARGSI